MNVNVYIERLVLDGISISPGQRTQLQAAVEGELTRLLIDGDAPNSWLLGGDVPQVSASPIQLTQDSKPNSLGVHIAQAVYGGISR